MLKFLTKLFGGTKSEKDLKIIKPFIPDINELYQQLNSLTDDQIKEKTTEFQSIIANNKQTLEDEKENILTKLKTERLTADQTADLTERLKALEKELFNNVQDTLDELLPEAFAVVKQACKRLTEQGFTYEYAGFHYK